jgi:hypothetical protein
MKTYNAIQAEFLPDCAYSLSIESESILNSFQNLRIMYGTGRAFVISGTGRDRKYGYRSGFKTKLGDIEQSDWYEQARQLIHMAGEDELHHHLLCHIKEHIPWIKTKTEAENEALQLHISRIFDDPLWVDFVCFNRQYRPDILRSTPLVNVRMEDGHEGFVTEAQVLQRKFSDAPTVCCPVCGKFDKFTLI